jgi:plastocyanin
VSRALAVAVALALAATLGLVPTGQGVGIGSGQASAADCAWQQHSKRVVKRVKRDGRVRRVVRVKRWWTCGQLPAPPVLGAPAPAPAPPPQPTPEPEPAVGRLSVKAAEFSFTLSRPTLAPGEAIVELNNQGEDPHNLNLRREDSEDPTLMVAEAGSLERRTARFTLAAGTYRLWCDLPEHDELGMNATLVVGAG